MAIIPQPPGQISYNCKSSRRHRASGCARSRVWNRATTGALGSAERLIQKAREIEQSWLKGIGVARVLQSANPTI